MLSLPDEKKCALRVRGLEKSFDGEPILQGIDPALYPIKLKYARDKRLFPDFLSRIEPPAGANRKIPWGSRLPTGIRNARASRAKALYILRIMRLDKSSRFD